MNNEANNLTGKFFHSFTEKGVIRWQGKILDHADPCTYLVQLYEWVVGEPSCQQFVDVEEIAGWAFYDDHDAWVDAYERRRDRITQIDLDERIRLMGISRDDVMKAKAR